MPIIFNSKVEIPDEVSNVYIKEHLMMETDEMVFEQFAKNLPLSNNKGSMTIRVRRLNTIDPAMTPLTEGVTPTGSKIAITNVDIPVKQYGDYTGYSDTLSTTSLDNTILDLSKVMGQQKGETKNKLCRNALLAGTNVVYAGGKLNRAALTSSDTLNQDFLDKIELTIKQGKAKRVTRAISTTDAVSMEPVAPAYVGFVSLNGALKIRNLAKFVPVEKYAQNGKIFKNEIGKVGNIRFIETSDLETIAGATKVEQMVVFGEEAYGRVETGVGGNGQLILKTLGEAGEDPLNQRGTLGWKDALGYKILNDKFIVRGEFAQ